MVAVVEGGRGVFVKRGARGVVVNRRQISGQVDQEPKKRGVVQFNSFRMVVSVLSRSEQVSSKIILGTE